MLFYIIKFTHIFRFHCKNNFNLEDNNESSETIHDEIPEDLFLSVQNLKFQGETNVRKRPRTSFKYKSLSDNKKHRMFVKQVVDSIDVDEDTSSLLTSYYFDDYVKYLLNNDRSRPSSGKSSLFLQSINNKNKENKSIQVDPRQIDGKKSRKELKDKNIKNTTTKPQPKPEDSKQINKPTETNMEDAKITYHKSGKRKSLTISRIPSPETVQVIRVDVVCNYNTNSILSDYYEDNKNTNTIDTSNLEKMENIKLKSSRFANKYLLTNTVKTLDENVSGGAKVTLLCKTFKLSDRSKLYPDTKNTKITKEGSKTKLRN